MRWRSTTGWTIWAFICSSPCATSAATGSCTAPLLACETDECPHFEMDEDQAELYKGLI